MASYSLILNTKFNPFTYDELIKAPLMATQAHQNIEEAYGELATNASGWGEKANEQLDPYAYSLYKAFEEDLNNRADQLLKQGLNTSSRKEMLDMKSRYSKEIVPIETAYKRREELAAEQRKARGANPTMLYERDASKMSLDDFIRNPSLDYGAQYSGALLTQQVSTAASKLANEITTPEGRRRIRKMLTENGKWLPYQYEVELQKGFTREDVDKAIRGDKDANPILTSIVDGVLQSSGINYWGDEQTKNLARYYANLGLYNAIGTKEFSNVTDSYGMKVATEGRKGGNGGNGGNNPPLFDPGKGRFPITSAKIGLNTSKEGEKNEKLRERFGNKKHLALIGGIELANRIFKTARANNPKYNNLIDLFDTPYIFTDEQTRWTRSNTVEGEPTIETIKTNGSFYDKNGNLYSKEEFYRNNPNLGKDYYDEYLSELSEYLGIPRSKLPKTYEEIEQAISNVEKGKGSGLMKGILLPMSEDDTQAAIDRAIMLNDDGDMLRIQEIEGFNDDGTLQLGDRIEMDELINPEKGKLRDKGYFTVMNTGGKPYLIFTMKGKPYNVPLENLGSISESANIDTDNMLQIQANIEEIGNEIGDPDWYSKVLDNATPERLKDPTFASLYETASYFEAALKNSGVGEVSKVVTALLHNLKAEDYKVSSQTGEYSPYTVNLNN